MDSLKKKNKEKPQESFTGLSEKGNGEKKETRPIWLAGGENYAWEKRDRQKETEKNRRDQPGEKRRNSLGRNRGGAWGLTRKN